MLPEEFLTEAAPVSLARTAIRESVHVAAVSTAAMVASYQRFLGTSRTRRERRPSPMAHRRVLRVGRNRRRRLASGRQASGNNACQVSSLRNAAARSVASAVSTPSRPVLQGLLQATSAPSCSVAAEPFSMCFCNGYLTTNARFHTSCARQPPRGPSSPPSRRRAHSVPLRPVNHGQQRCDPSPRTPHRSAYTQVRSHPARQATSLPNLRVRVRFSSHAPCIPRKSPRSGIWGFRVAWNLQSKHLGWWQSRYGRLSPASRIRDSRITADRAQPRGRPVRVSSVV